MLNIALDIGIAEKDFWDMTFAEVQRANESYIRVKKVQTQEKAIFDYLLANLITKGVSKVLGDKSEYPTLEEAYPGVFDDVVQEQKAKIEEQKMHLSALRFKQFAQSYNKRFEEVAKDK